MKLDYQPFQITKNFHSLEFSCKDLTKTKVPQFYLQNVVYVAVQLQKIRDFLQLDLLRINSGYRTRSHNTRVNGNPNSNHLTAQAADIAQLNQPNKKFYQALKQLIEAKLIPDGELLEYDTFVHYAPRYATNHLPQKFTPMYKDLDKHYLTYNKDINHAQFAALQKIREAFNQIKTN